MTWRSLILVIVPLIQLNVLAAEAYVGNSGGWNSRSLDFQRPTLVNTRPNPVTRPIHMIPRPMPKSIELPRTPEVSSTARTIVEVENTEIPPTVDAPQVPIVRSYTRTLPQRFNLSRRPIAAPAPRPIVVPQPVVVPEPVVVPQREIIPAPQPEPIIATTVAPTTPQEELMSTEDIEAKVNKPLPSSRRYMMSRPLPRPISVQWVSSNPPVAPATPEPIRSVTILENEQEPIPEEPIIISTPKVEEWTSKAIEEPEPATIIVSPSPTTEIIPRFINPEVEEEPVYIEEAIEEVPVSPVEIVSSTARPIPVTRPERVIINSRRPEPIPSSVSIQPHLRRPVPPIRRPITPIPARVVPKPVIPTPVKPIPPTTMRVPVTRRPVPVVRTETEAPTQLMDYVCAQVDGYYSMSDQCDSYVECKSSIAYLASCPDGLHFNPRALWPEYPCAYPSEVQCKSNSYIQKAQPTEECPRQFGFFPIANSDCSQYIICQDGMGTVMNCPPGLVFNAEMSACDWPANVPSCTPEVFRGFTCPAAPLEDDGFIDEITKYRYNQSCREYIACQGGRPRLLKCDPGLSFDEESGFCINSEYVQNCRN